MPKIVEIAVAECVVDNESYTRLYVLDEQGGVWYYHRDASYVGGIRAADDTAWVRFPSLPNGEGINEQ